jgi:hypothetical protein
MGLSRYIKYIYYWNAHFISFCDFDIGRYWLLGLIQIYVPSTHAYTHVLRLSLDLFVDIRIKTSKNGISILLLFMVKRIWSFKELSSVWKISRRMSEFHIIKQSSRKRFQFCRTYDANSWQLDHIHSLKRSFNNRSVTFFWLREL